ncbi:MAG: polysulfide reductase NrfD [Polyangiaceae bacterium]|nr:polysulfide reductase NrfD [Polyangiaceae bacterium]
MRQDSAGSSLVLRAVVGCLSLLVVTGIVAYGVQYGNGLSVTGLSRAVPWGLYISQFTFLVGIAASSVLVVLPRYVHGANDSADLVTIGEAISVAALVEAFSFVLVDLGRPVRLFYVLLHPAPSSLMFWDVLTLTGYLLLCSTVLSLTLCSPPGTHPRAVRPLVLVSVPFAFGIHVVTALLYAGLAARSGWMTAILAPKFLATAFASGSALLLLVTSALDAAHVVRIEPVARNRLATMMTYSLAAALLCTGLETFTALYSGLPGLAEHFAHLYIPAHQSLGPAVIMLASTALVVFALVVLLVSPLRRRAFWLHLASGAVLAAVFLEKGLVFVPSGFAPPTLGDDVGYAPTAIELLIVAGIHSAGALVFLTLLRPISARARGLGLGMAVSAHDSRSPHLGGTAARDESALPPPATRPSPAGVFTV